MIYPDEISEVFSADSTNELRDKFERNGYVVVRSMLNLADDIQPVIDEYADVLDRRAMEWHAAGDLSSAYANLAFQDRVMAVVSETGGRIYNFFRIFFDPPKTTADSPIHYGPAIFGLLTNTKLLDVIEALIGPEITVNPVNIARLKVPERLLPATETKTYNSSMTKTWWHQDEGAYSDDISDVDMLTVWVPLTDARRDMGCLEVVPGSHKGEFSVHCWSDDDINLRGIPEMMLGNIRHYVEMEVGDVHFHHRRIQHGALRNVSDQLRFSFDLRYQPTDQMPGVSHGMPKNHLVPGVIARSRSSPSREMSDWQEWADYQEEMRMQFMAIDWENSPVANRFMSEHRYCV